MEDKTPVVGGNPAAASGGSRGTSQTGARLYNERLILSLIRRHPGLAKVEIARVDRDYRDQPLIILKQRPEKLTVSRTFAHLFKAM